MTEAWLYRQNMHGASFVSVPDHLTADQVSVGSGDGGNPIINL